MSTLDDDELSIGSEGSEERWAQEHDESAEILGYTDVNEGSDVVLPPSVSHPALDVGPVRESAIAQNVVGPAGSSSAKRSYSVDSVGSRAGPTPSYSDHITRGMMTMTLKQLQTQCSNKGIPQYGCKLTLVSRLRNYLGIDKLYKL